MTVRIRGIYATALTELLTDDEHAGGTDAEDSSAVVQPSATIDTRFPDHDLPIEPAAASVSTTPDRQGVGIVGLPRRVADVTVRFADVAPDALAWRAPFPRGAIYDGEITRTVRSGAVVRLGEPDEGDDSTDLQAVDSLPVAAAGDGGFLPSRNAEEPLTVGDRVRVQVREPVPPWDEDRPLLDTTFRIERSLLTLQRGGVIDAGGPHLGDLLSTDPPADWGIRWPSASENASLDALGTVLTEACTQARDIDETLEDVASADDDPSRIAGGDATTWVWFGRESRFALDALRRRLTPTMAGHHRTKSGADAASAAVDFVEAVCPAQATGTGDEGNRRDNGTHSNARDDGFPFAVVTSHFGPAVGDRVAIHHGKPDGRLLTLGQAEVTDVDADGSVTVERELTSSGTYDGLGTPRERGDVATTKLLEGRWWYPTTYRSADGELRGTYVNVCTPVEVFPDAVRYVDLHVDVVKRPDGTVERVDDDELDAAEAGKFVSADLAAKARSVASAVESAL